MNNDYYPSVDELVLLRESIKGLGVAKQDLDFYQDRLYESISINKNSNSYNNYRRYKQEGIGYISDLKRLIKELEKITGDLNIIIEGHILDNV